MDLQDRFVELVLSVINRLEQARKSRPQLDDEDDIPLPFGWTAGAIASLLAEYPSGVTEAIILSEVDRRFDEGDVRTADKNRATVERLVESRSVRQEDVFECVVQEVRAVPNTQTAFLRLRDRAGGDGGGPGGGGDSVEMYVHQKYGFLLGSGLVQPDHQVRFVGSRLVDRQAQRLTILPTPYMSFRLDQERHGHLFAHTLRGVDMANYVDANSGVLFKVLDIGPVEKAKTPGKLKQLRVSLREAQGESPPEAVFVLWDEQVLLGGLFRRGDLLGIYRPYVAPPGPHNAWQQPPFLEYGSATLTFFEPFEAQQEAVQSLSQVRGGQISQILPRDDEGNVDYRLYASPLAIGGLRPRQVNVALLGKVRALDEAARTVTLGDASGEVVVQLCEELWGDSPLEVGHCLLLNNAGTRPSAPVTVAAAWREGATLVNLNLLTGLLSCEMFWHPVGLEDATHTCFQCVGTITSASYDAETRAVHWTLCDRGGEIRASVSRRVFLEALRVSARDFDRATDKARQAMVDLMVGKDFRFIVSQPAPSDFRIDAYAERNLVADTLRLLARARKP